jgi:cation:H+ antiporter
MPALLAVTLLTVLLFLDGGQSRIDGVLLLAGLGVVMHWLVRLGTQSEIADPIQQEIEAEMPEVASMAAALGWLAVGLMVLLGGAQLLVWGAHHLAVELGVSDLIIGLTVVAIGTSLPELAVSVVSALKNEHDIALGNIVGSNMFNCLAVIGPSALIDPTDFTEALLRVHLPVMGALTLALFALTYNFTGTGRIGRLEGGLLLAAFFGYQFYLLGTL